jgi:hypothetical protein
MRRGKWKEENDKSDKVSEEKKSKRRTKTMRENKFRNQRRRDVSDIVSGCEKKRRSRA